MKHFINLKDIPAKDLRKIIIDAKKRKSLRKKLSTLEIDKDAPLKGKLLIQMFEKSSLRTRLSFYLAIKLSKTLFESPIQQIFNLEMGFLVISSTVKTSDKT